MENTNKKVGYFKGQIILKANFLVLIWTKKPNKITYFLISALAFNMRLDQKNKKNKGTLYH